MSETETDQETAGGQHSFPDITLPAGYVMDVLDALEPVKDVATFRFDQNGMGVAETDRYGVVLVNMKATTGEEDTVNLDEPFYVRTGVSSLRRAVGDVAGRHDTVEFNRAPNQLIVACGGPENHTKLDTGEQNASDMHSVRPPEFTADATVRVRSSYLVGVVEAMAHAAGQNEPLSLTAEDGSVYVGYGRAKTVTESWEVPEHAVRNIEHDDKVQAWFNADYLTNVIGGVPATRTVTLSWADDYPVRVEADRNWMYWVSPRIFSKSVEDGDDDE